MFFQCSGPSCITGTFVPGEIDDGACSVNSHTLGKCVKCNSHGGTIQGDCPDNYLCNSNGKCVEERNCTEDEEASCPDDHPICEVDSNGKADCHKCSKDASGGKPGDGDGTTQGNCEMGKICHATGECEGI